MEMGLTQDILGISQPKVLSILPWGTMSEEKTPAPLLCVQDHQPLFHYVLELRTLGQLKIVGKTKRIDRVPLSFNLLLHPLNLETQL